MTKTSAHIHWIKSLISLRDRLDNHYEFVNDSFIPQDQIEEIIVFNQHSRSKKVIFKNKEEGDEK